MPVSIATLEDLEALLEQHPEWQERLAEKILNERTLRRALQKNPELREALRREVLGEELLKLPELVRELTEAVKGLDTRVERLEERMDRVEQVAVETREELRETRAEVKEMREELTETRAEVKEINDWRRGEVGRRAGEQYEEKMVLRAPRIFGAGQGGSPRRDRFVRDQVAQWLVEADLLEDDGDDDPADPLLADIVWWKPSGKVAVVEVSLKVNGQDVQRAQLRAQTLRTAGLEVTPVVVGSEWAHPETKELAAQAGVEWRVGKDYSEGLKAFRRAS